MNIPVLMYHSVSDKKNKMSVSKNNFKKQMKLMNKFGFKGVNLKDIDKNEMGKKFVITFDDGYEDVFINAFPILCELGFGATCFFVTNQIGKSNTWDKNLTNYHEMKIMNDKQINEWHKNGLEVGSHSLDHKNLTKINFMDKSKQIIDSKNVFKNKYNIEVKSFSYPFGYFDDECIQLIKKNYEYAVTTKRSRYMPKKFDKAQIPRVPINSNTSIIKFMLKVFTIYEDIKY
tara:strand:- start:222 stop:914 length:693 start_codon:yes stop_codon:yes gene_type:complete